MSMDFHPVKQTLLLVGTTVGAIELLEVASRERLVQRNFKVWDLNACSMILQAGLVKDPEVSVNRIIWSPDGSLFGVAYSKHLIQIYSYHGHDDVRQHLEIDAHVGGVNDLAFSHPNKQLYVVTCGDDKLIKVWDTTTGRRQYVFQGHEAPVYSVYPHHKENLQLCVWSCDGWEKQRSRFLQLASRKSSAAQTETRVQFHQDQIHFLVVHESKLAIDETAKLECLKQWAPRESAALISDATFSCDSQLVYASFLDATVCIFTAARFHLLCRINPSAYLPSSISSNVQPLVVAVHPQEVNQFALGLSDCSVHVFEPPESEGKWGLPPPAETDPPVCRAHL